MRFDQKLVSTRHAPWSKQYLDTFWWSQVKASVRSSIFKMLRFFRECAFNTMYGALIKNRWAPDMHLDTRNILTNFDDHWSNRLGGVAFWTKKHVLTSGDPYVTSDPKLLTDRVVVNTTILLTKFGQNRLYGLGAVGLLPERRRFRRNLARYKTLGFHPR
jgi:hypothetical protein